MNIDEIKTIDLCEWLKLNGYGSGKKKGKNIWFCSPFRHESSPSFSVDPGANLWFDFGVGEGGNIINLVQRINPTWTNHEILSYLERQAETHNLSYVTDPDKKLKEAEASEEYIRKCQQDRDAQTSIQQISEITHPYLRDYILQRRIDFNIARSICKEVHYTVDGKSYYAIAFMNKDNGMETRNKFFKRCIGHKTISIIQQKAEPLDHCCVFEGFFDLLTYLTIIRWMDIGICIDEECDYFVLNSTSCVNILLPYLRSYPFIHCYLDNDDAGINALKSIQAAYPEATDESIRYKGYNDLNDVINGITIRKE